jgi:hypothetical protein
MGSRPKVRASGDVLCLVPRLAVTLPVLRRLSLPAHGAKSASERPNCIKRLGAFFWLVDQMWHSGNAGRLFCARPRIARDLPHLRDDLTLGIGAKEEREKKRGEAWGDPGFLFFAIAPRIFWGEMSGPWPS